MAVNPYWLQVGGKLALLALLGGIAFRRRSKECWSFVAYAVVVLVLDSMVMVWPERFWVWSFWILEQACFDAAKLTVAVELAWRAFRLFPGARATARRAFVAILLLTTLSVAAVTPGRALSDRGFYEAVFFQWEPRVLNATIWLFVATERLVLWYNLPVSRWHRAISLGFAGYLVIFVTGFNVVRRFGWDMQPWANLVDGVAYLLLCSWWAYEAWRPDGTRDVAPHLVPLGLRSG